MLRLVFVNSQSTSTRGDCHCSFSECEYSGRLPLFILRVRVLGEIATVHSQSTSTRGDCYYSDLRGLSVGIYQYHKVKPEAFLGPLHLYIRALEN